MAHLITLLVALLCLSGSSFGRSWVGFDDKDISWEADSSEEEPEPYFKYYSEHGSWESDDDYNDSGFDHGHGNDLHSLNNQGYHNDREGHTFSCDHGHQNEFTHQHHGHNEYWGSHGHNSQTAASGKPGLYGVPHHGQPEAPHGYHSGSYGHHGEHWGSHGHSSQTGSSSQRPNGPPRELPQNNLIPPQRSSNDADRVVFPDFNNQVPTTRAPQSSRPGTTTVRPTTSTMTDRTLLDLVICIRACPATSEYNPVCGTNNVTYNNPGALQCARNCGLNVAVARQAPCPRFFPQGPQPTTVSPATNPTTRAPITSPTTVRPSVTSQTPVRTTVTPTRFTNIDVNLANRPDATLIPLDILESVFGSAPTNTEEPEFDIDKRLNP